MAVWLRRCASFAEESEADRDYWSHFAPDERVALIADLRREWSTMNGTNDPPSGDFTDFLQALAQHEVKALIIGAFAVAFHAKPRFTKDLDIFVAATPENAARLLGYPPHRIDLVTSIDGVTFDEAWASRVAGNYGGIAVWYIGRDALIRNKTAAARPQDLADIATLR